MSVFGICFSPSNHRPLLLNSHFPESANTQTPNATSNTTGEISSCSGVTRRNLNISNTALIFSVLIPVVTAATPVALGEDTDAEDVQLERYTDTKEGFTLLKPSSYVKIDKAGATVLFEAGDNRSNNVGVVVSPVRLTSLKDFGTPQFVADKLIQAEKRKESTKDVQLVAASERTSHEDLPVYEIEYKIDSTRGGMKRIFSASFVSDKKLYLLNIVHADKLENPLDVHTRTVLEQILRSFDIVST